MYVYPRGTQQFRVQGLGWIQVYSLSSPLIYIHTYFFEGISGSFDRL